MKKTICCICAFVLLGLVAAYADEEQRFRLNNIDKTSDACTIMGAFNNEVFRIGCQLSEVTDDGAYSIKVVIENYDPNYYLCYFTYPFTAKQLRQSMKPKLVFSKNFRQEMVKTCTYLAQDGRGGILIPPGGKEAFTVKGCEDDVLVEVSLPLYIARQKGKKFELLDVRTEVLQFEVEVKPSPSYERFREEVDDTLKHISTMKYVICNHKNGKKHNPSLEEQKAATRHVLDSLKREISMEMNQRKTGSKRYNEFRSLIDKLDKVNLDAIPVEECTIVESSRTCSCPAWVTKMSLQQISYRMEELYLQIYNGEKSKADVINEVKVLWTHTGHIKSDPNKLKKGIQRYYNKINSL